MVTRVAGLGSVPSLVGQRVLNCELLKESFL